MMDSDSDIDIGLSPEEEDQLFIDLAAKFPALHQKPPIAVTTVLDSLPERADNTHCSNESPAGGLASPLTPGEDGSIAQVVPTAGILPLAASTDLPALPSPVSLDQEIVYPNLSRALSGLEAAKAPPREASNSEESDEDDRSPLQRFRSYPRKPLTVSDLTSGAWCELQYWYTLTRLPGGRRTRTAAMRQGSKVHQQLEDEVHKTVHIEISSKEDAFGLRLWNFVQGLRTLRDTGLTRELEVWGMIDGNLVNGVIDSASYENPNPEFENELSRQGSQQSSQQPAITDYFPPQNPGGMSKGDAPRIYLADVKTRGNAKPVSAAILRPAKIQLLLYHRFLSDMAAGRLDFLKIFRRYGLDADDAFSDAFIAQIGSLHDEIFRDSATGLEDQSNSSSTNQTQDENFEWSSSAAELDLLKYRTLRELAPLVQDEIALTFPHGEQSLGHMLRVQYVHRNDGRELDKHDFPVSRQALEKYLDSYMTWWRGERKASGVDIEEAFKCQICEFAPSCSWRRGMDEARLRRVEHRLRGRGRTAE
ncbi:Exonuclease V [Paramyrothecium foliicola]|nr:Exonuclease V [Paramyrothecium foliicola]